LRQKKNKKNKEDKITHDKKFLKKKSKKNSEKKDIKN